MTGSSSPLRPIIRGFHAFIRCVLFSAAILVSSTPRAQCPYDFTNDGFVDMFDADFLLQLAHFGDSTSEADHNGNGTVDILDVMEFIRHAGNLCPVDQVPEESGRIQGLVMTQHWVHEETMANVTDTLEAGSITYRLYAQLTDATDVIAGIFGLENQEASIAFDAPLFQSAYGGFVADDIDPFVYAFVPIAEYDSYWAGGFGPEELMGSPVHLLSTNSSSFEDSASTNLGWNWNDAAGTGIINLSLYNHPEPEWPDLRLMGQFTLPPEASLSGTLNLQIATLNAPNGTEVLSYEQASALTFSTDILTEFGCTDDEAENYNPSAGFDDGTCTYFGDFDGDGTISISDLLELIGNFGCTTCDELDLDGDGVIGVGDVLGLLGLI